MSFGQLIPSLISLSPNVWFEVYVTHSTAIAPSTRIAPGSVGAVIPDGDLRYYPGDQPPTQDYNAYRAAPGGIALLAADPQENEGLRQATRWWVKSESTYDVEYLLSPMATDSEYQVFAHSKPGFTFPTRNLAVALPAGAAPGGLITLLAQVNPSRKYLGLFNSSANDAIVTLDTPVNTLDPDLTPAAAVGIVITGGGSMEWHGSTLQRMRVRGRSIVGADIYVVEGM